MSDRYTMAELLASIPQTGRVEEILVSPKRRAKLERREHQAVVVGSGLPDDHHAKRRPGGKRQVTLIQAEHLPVIAALAGHASVDPADLRRNIVVSGIPVNALRGMRFRLGTAVLEGTVPCDPCSRMEEVLGPGGFNAMRGMGGICARVVEDGEVRVGDSIVSLGASKQGPAVRGM